MGKFKGLVIDILEMYEDGTSVAEIAQYFQVRRDIVEYVIEMHGCEFIDDTAANTTPGQ